MTRLLIDERDQRFVLFDLLGVQDALQIERFEHVDQDTIDMLLDEAQKFSEQRLFPLNIENDKIGATFADGDVCAAPGMRDAYQEFVEGGWLTMSESAELGGQDLPEVIKFATHEMFLAANFPFMCYVNLTHDAAKLIELFGDDDQRSRYMEQMYVGEWTGTMCLTEPGAGSDVGALKTRARLADDGSYRIKGQKIYVTNGEHDLADNIVHLVLARIEGDPDGTRGLSLFVVPKYRVDDDGTPGPGNDVNCMGIEHKMGLHASPTTTLSFGDDDDCHGYLLGQQCDGTRIMFHMMNQSRLEVGLFGLGTCSMSYLHALEYARERRQGSGLSGEPGQVPIIQHPDVRRNLMTMKAYVEGMRAMVYYCAFAMDQAELASSQEESARWQGITELLIPIVKAHPTEKGVELSSLGIQVFGGCGYTCERPIEQFLRDSKVACIFEGTTGIQGMDFALRKAHMRGGFVYRDFLASMDPVLEQADAMQDWVPYVEQLRKTRDALLDVPEILTSGDKANRLRDQLLTATQFMEATGDFLTAYFLLWGAMVAEKKIGDLGGLPDVANERSQLLENNPTLAFLAGKRETARFFIVGQLPLVDGKIASLKWKDPSACEIAEASM